MNGYAAYPKLAFGIPGGRERQHSPLRQARGRTAGTNQRMACAPRSAAGFCFTEACQAAQDRDFLLATALPLAVAAGIALKKFRSPPNTRYLDPEQGSGLYISLDTNEEEFLEKDRNGKLVYTPISYTPLPCAADAPGERLRLEVGPVGARAKRTFVFEKTMRDSIILAVTLPRPMGVVFEEQRPKQAVAVELIPNTHAERAFKLAQFNKSLESEAVLPGDLLRAVTATTLVYPPQSLVGVRIPRRTVVLFGADGQPWAKTAEALQRGVVGDGDVTLVLERRSHSSGSP
mmetsp:Transcript_25228/g.47686  ORF Transcript_25228/g.47686 Transcript_25228/m.47686 type:complete len:289 (-) Transcript_25228:299-1165(-)